MVSAAVSPVRFVLIMPASNITITTSSLSFFFIIIFLIIIFIIIILIGVMLTSYIVIFFVIIIFLVIIFVIIILVILVVPALTLLLAIPGTAMIPVIVFHCGKTPASSGNHRLSFKSLRIFFKKINNSYAVCTKNENAKFFLNWNGINITVVKRNFTFPVPKKS